MTDLQSQVDALQSRVSKASSKVQQLKGKSEAAKSAKAAVEEECKSKKINPEKIDKVLTQLHDKFETESAQLQTKIKEVETALESFQEA